MPRIAASERAAAAGSRTSRPTAYTDGASTVSASPAPLRSTMLPRSGSSFIQPPACLPARSAARSSNTDRWAARAASTVNVKRSAARAIATRRALFRTSADSHRRSRAHPGFARLRLARAKLAARAQVDHALGRREAEPLRDLHEPRRIAQPLEHGDLLPLLLDERLLLADRLAERVAHAQDVDPQRGERERARERRFRPARRSGARRAAPHARTRAKSRPTRSPGGRAPHRCAHAASATRSAARSRAERERGLREISAGPGEIGRFVSTRSRTRPPHTQTGTSRRAGAAARRVAQPVLHDPVLGRVIGDHHEPPARAQRGDRGVEPLRERVELVVGRDPQRLEHQRRGIVAPAAADPRLADHAQQVGRGAQRRALARGDQRAREPPRAAQVRIAAQPILELLGGRAAQQLGGVGPRARIHAHVERRALRRYRRRSGSRARACRAGATRRRDRAARRRPGRRRARRAPGAGRGTTRGRAARARRTRRAAAARRRSRPRRDRARSIARRARCARGSPRRGRRRRPCRRRRASANPARAIRGSPRAARARERTRWPLERGSQPMPPRRSRSSPPVRAARVDSAQGRSSARRFAGRELGCLGAPLSLRNRAVPPIDYPISLRSGAPRTPPTSVSGEGLASPEPPRL